jgi:hypothetical protein
MNFIARSSFRRVRTVAVNQSPFNGATYRSGMQDDRWVFRFDYVPMTRQEAGPLLGAIAAQRNGTGTLSVYDPDFKVRLGGTGAANGLVNGGSQTGMTLNTDGWSPSVTVAKAGSKLWIADPNIGFFMYELTADAVSNSSGQAAMALDIPLRATPPDNVAVGFLWGDTGAYVGARLTGFEKETGDDGLFRISISGEEII